MGSLPSSYCGFSKNYDFSLSCFVNKNGCIPFGLYETSLFLMVFLRVEVLDSIKVKVACWVKANSNFSYLFH